MTPLASIVHRVLVAGTRLAMVCAALALGLALLVHARDRAPDLSSFAPAPSDVRGVAQPAFATFSQMLKGNAPNPWSLAQLTIVLLACVPLASVVVLGVKLWSDPAPSSKALAWCAALVVLALLAGLAGVPLHA
jgi:hypothetical protein